MKTLGIAVAVLGAMLIGRGLFALAWDAGTPRTADDWLFVGLGGLLLAAGGAMIAERTWGWKLALTIVVVLGAVAIFQAVLRVRSSDDAARLALYELPEWSPRPETNATLPPREWARTRGIDAQWRTAMARFETRVASAFSSEWWATPIEDLRRLRRQNDAIAKDWEIQGDAQTRLVVLNDPTLPTLADRLFPLNAFLLINAGKTRIARAVVDGFYTADRDGPIALTLRSDGERQIAPMLALS